MPDERTGVDPQGVLDQRIYAAAFEWHNYGKSTIGNRTDIERVPIENLQAFYKKFYQPDNVVLIVAGKIDERLEVLGVAVHGQRPDVLDSEIGRDLADAPRTGFVLAC